MRKHSTVAYEHHKERVGTGGGPARLRTGGGVGGRGGVAGRGRVRVRGGRVGGRGRGRGRLGRQQRTPADGARGVQLQPRRDARRVEDVSAV